QKRSSALLHPALAVAEHRVAEFLTVADYPLVRPSVWRLLAGHPDHHAVLAHRQADRVRDPGGPHAGAALRVVDDRLSGLLQRGAHSPAQAVRKLREVPGQVGDLDREPTVSHRSPT